MVQEQGREAGSLVPMAVLLAALTYATVAQGAFYPGPYHVVLVLLAVAVVAAAGTGRLNRRVLAAWARDPLVDTSVALGLVVVLSAAVGGDAGEALGTDSLLVAVPAVVLVVRSLDDEGRRWLTVGLVALGCAVALVGWAAVVGRRSPQALEAQGLWRAASTLTYENALGAYVSVPALLGLERLGRARPAPGWWGATFVLLVGLGASLSRGALAGLAVGVVVLLVARGPRALARAWPPALGALVALGALAPSLPTDAAGRGALAVAGFVAGALVAYAGLLGRRGKLGVAATVALAAAVAAAVVPFGHVADVVRSGRLSGSSDRAHEWGATLTILHHHLVLGTGADRVLLHWDAGGHFFTATFTHNEFLQLAAEYGLLGAGVLVAGLVVVFVRLVRRWGGGGPWPAEAATAGLAAFCVESALDFLWHIPALPLLVVTAVSVNLASTPDVEKVSAAVPEAAKPGGC